MSLARKAIGRLNAGYPRLEAIVINNTGADLTQAMVGGVLLLDWLPSGSNQSAIAPTTLALIAGCRKAVLLDLLGSGKQGTKVKVLLQGEDSLLVPTGTTAKDRLLITSVSATGVTALSAIAAQTVGSTGQEIYTNPICAAALAANASGSVTLTSCFFDGTDFNAAYLKKSV